MHLLIKPKAHIHYLSLMKKNRPEAHAWPGPAKHCSLVLLFFVAVTAFVTLLLAGRMTQAQPLLSSGLDWTDITSDYELPDGLRVFSESGINAWYVEFDTDYRDLALHPYLLTSQGLPSFSREVGAIVAINGGYFAGGASLSTIVYPGGQVMSQNPRTLTRDGVSYPVTRGHFGVRDDRSMSVDWIYHFSAAFSDLYRFSEPVPNERGTPATAPVRTDGEPFDNLLVGIGGGPVLIKDGEVNITFTEELIWGGVGEFNERRARTAVCHTGDDRVLLFVANESPGLAFDQLADILLDLGCYEALNLDGGGSTHMTINHELVNYSFVNRQVPTILAIVPADSVAFPVEPLEEVILDTEMDEVTLTSGWFPTANEGYFGESPSMVVAAGDGSETATYLPDLEPMHEYEVSGWWVASFNRTKNTPYIVHHAEGVDTVRVDQSIDGSRWVSIGTYFFSGPDDDKVIISNDASGAATPSYAVADAIRFAMTGNTLGDETRAIHQLPDSRNRPDRISLGENYPNPFNPSTTIPFRLNQSTHLTITVYDLLGRAVSIPAEGYFESGSHRVSFDAGGLSGGVYVYELAANGYRSHKKMLLLK